MLKPPTPSWFVSQEPPSRTIGQQFSLEQHHCILKERCFHILALSVITWHWQVLLCSVKAQGLRLPGKLQATLSGNPKPFNFTEHCLVSVFSDINMPYKLVEKSGDGNFKIVNQRHLGSITSSLLIPHPNVFNPLLLSSHCHLDKGMPSKYFKA